MFPNKMAEQYIENTTRLREDMKFLFLCWKNISRVSAAKSEIYEKRNFYISKRPCNVLFII